MKLALIALACVAAVFAAPAPPGSSDAEAQIVRSEFDQQPEGGYVYSFETNNGIQRQETGELKQALDEENKPHDVVVVRGSYTYNDADGKPWTITYRADETGFHAEGDAIPKSVARRDIPKSVITTLQGK